MLRLPILTVGVFLGTILGPMLTCRAQEDPGNIFGKGFPTRFSTRLKQIEARLERINDEILRLPVMSDVEARGTHGFHSNFSSESEEHWFQLSWQTPQTLDGLALVPARITTQSGMRSNYGFPKRLRIEATRAGQRDRFILTETGDTRLDLRQGEPLFLNLQATGITSLRFIPIDLPPLPGKEARFFSLAEVMVFHQQRNIARDAKLSANYSINYEVGWNIRYLVDEQLSTGPPELPLPGNSLGWHGHRKRNAKPAWAMIDLGSPLEFDSVRLVAARGDAPVKGPGFGFPEKFTLEITDEIAGVAKWKTIWTSGNQDVPNPGYNPMTLRFPPARGRYVRLSVQKLHSPDHLTTPVTLLSEMEVLHGPKNLALGRPVSTPDPYESIQHDATRVWSRAGLTDGHSSTGLLIPEREWVQGLSRRFDLICERSRLHAERTRLLIYWHNVSLSLTLGCLFAAIVALALWLIRSRLLNRRAVAALRTRISSDLHDEVGSNLATIALLSELESSEENLDDINRLSRETSLALHEIVDITIRKRPRKELLDRLQDIASLMLRDHTWTFKGEDSPVFDLEQRKNLVFYFKESLHNIIRHARAKNVNIVLEKSPPHFRLTIQDDGVGIQDSSPDVMGNLETLRQRAERLRGTFEVDSEPGNGTRLTLLFPVRIIK